MKSSNTSNTFYIYALSILTICIYYIWKSSTGSQYTQLEGPAPGSQYRLRLGATAGARPKTGGSFLDAKAEPGTLGTPGNMPWCWAMKIVGKSSLNRY